MEPNLGSNIMRNTNGILKVGGKEQIHLELGEEDNQLLLTMDIYDVQGMHIAKLRRNAWAFNNKNRFEVKTAPSSLQLIDRQTSGVVVEVNVLSKDKVQILHGKFYTHQGHVLEITPSFWGIAGSIRMSGSVIDGCGTAVSIG